MVLLPRSTVFAKPASNMGERRKALERKVQKTKRTERNEGTEK